MRFSMKEIWRSLDGPRKNKELWSYVVKYEFSRPKNSSVKSKLMICTIYRGAEGTRPLAKCE